ncbi:MAG: phospholipid carrier-dependent glycosyltransferase [Streptosporangiaceae bacterium]
MTETEPPSTTKREWLAPKLPGSALWAWLGPLLVTAFAGFLRFDRLGQPRAVVFDETYYAKDAYSLWKFGYEHKVRATPDGIADRLFLAGKPDQMWDPGAAFVAHPPVGKWMIALGEWMFGVTPFGWRFMAALTGTLAVLIMCRLARRMTGSTLLGCAAGLLMALDGLQFVSSRTAILDIFLMFWLLAGFACLVADRDRSRVLLGRRLDADPDGALGFGPHIVHGWRILAGVCLGLACGTKWTGIFYVVAFFLLAVVWDMGARRAADIEFPHLGAVLKDGASAVLSLVMLPLLVYVASWSGWIFNSGGYGRGTVAKNVWARPWESLPNLWSYHKAIYGFHTSLKTEHPYQSWPWDWPVLRRPVAFYYTDKDTGCGAAKCSREVLGIGTPAIWWTAVAALLVMVFLWLVHRDWRAGAILLGYAAGWLSWFPSAFGDRTMFMFYALPLLPFMILAIVISLGLVIGPASLPGPRRMIGSAVAGLFVLAVLVNFWYLYPVLAAKNLPYDLWNARMWFKSWI